MSLNFLMGSPIKLICCTPHSFYIILPKDVDEPEIQCYSGNDVKIVGKCEFYAHIKGFKKPKFSQVIVVDSEADDMNTWQLLQKWGAVPKSFPY